MNKTNLQCIGRGAQAHSCCTTPNSYCRKAIDLTSWVICESRRRKNRWGWGKNGIWNAETEQNPILSLNFPASYLHMHIWKCKFPPIHFRNSIVTSLYWDHSLNRHNLESKPSLKHWQDKTCAGTQQPRSVHSSGSDLLSLVWGACSSERIKIESGMFLRKHQPSVVLQVNDILLKPYGSVSCRC